MLTAACFQWATTWDRSSLLTYTNLSPNPINFGNPGAIGQADIVVNDQDLLQEIHGFGASLSTHLQLFSCRCA